MLWRKLRGAILLAWLVALPGPAWAQGEKDADAQNREAGKARYERGVEAYSAGRFKDAIDLFLQADALAPSAALSFNIARAYEKIGDDAATLQWYRDFRRRAPDAKNGPEVDARIRTLEGVLAKKGVQQVTVFSTPPGATVIVDDKPLGVTPFTGQLAPGEHHLVLTLKGYSDATQSLALPADHAEDVTVALSPAPDAGGAPVVAATSSVSATEDKGANPAPERSGPRFGIWPWVGVGAGAATLGASLAFEMSRRSAESKAEGDDTQVGYKDKLDSMRSRQTTARVLAAVGGALVLTGGALLVVDLTSRPRKGREQPRVGLACLPGACGLDVRGQF